MERERLKQQQQQQQTLTPIMHDVQYKHEQQYQHQHIPHPNSNPRFVRSNISNVHQLTPTNRKHTHNHIPLYSHGGSTQITNVTTPNPASSSTNRNRSNPNLSHISPNRINKSPNKFDEKFKYGQQVQPQGNNSPIKHGHQYKTSSGNLIAIERSIGPNSSPKLPVINANNNTQLFDMLTADPMPSHSGRSGHNNMNKMHSRSNLEQPPKYQRSKSHDHSSRNQRPTPRKPLLPPKIIKLDSPTVTTINDLSSSSSEKDRNANNETHKKRRKRHHQRSSGLSDIPNIDDIINEKPSDSPPTNSSTQRRSFQITRRPLSPAKQPNKSADNDMTQMSLNKPYNNNTTNKSAPKRMDNTKNQRGLPVMALVSDSIPTNAPHEEEKSNQIVDYLSDVIARDHLKMEKHPTNEYDPLDLNDSAMKSTRWTPQQMPIQAPASPSSPSPQQQQVTYPMLSFVISPSVDIVAISISSNQNHMILYRLSEENLSLHQARLSKHKHQSPIDTMKMQLNQGSMCQARSPSNSNPDIGSMTENVHVLDDDENMDDPNNRNSNSTNDNDKSSGTQRKHTKDLSASNSGLLLQNIVKHNLLRPQENSESNFTTNSKAVVINPSSVDETATTTNRHLKAQQSLDIIQPFDSLELSASGNNKNPNLLPLDLNNTISADITQLSGSPNNPSPDVEPARDGLSGSGSAIDLLKVHKPNGRRGGNDNAYANYNYMNMQDEEGSVRSSVMSLENILQERGLYRKNEKEKIRQARDVPLDSNKKINKSTQPNEQDRDRNTKHLKSPSPQNKNKNKNLKSPKRSKGSRSTAKSKSKSKRVKKPTSTNTNITKANTESSHGQQASGSITDSRSLLDHLLEYQSDDINKYNSNYPTSNHTLNTNITDFNDTALHGIIPDEEEDKMEEDMVNDYVERSPDAQLEYDENEDDLGMYAQLDPELLVNNPHIQVRHAHNNKKRHRKMDSGAGGRAHAFAFGASSSNSITPQSIEPDSDYKEHTDIHSNLQKHLESNQHDPTQSISQSDIIHPHETTPTKSNPYRSPNTISPPPAQSSKPMTSPLTHAKHQHYSFGSSNIHKTRKTLFSKYTDMNSNNNIVSDGDSDDISSLSALSPNISPNTMDTPSNDGIGKHGMVKTTINISRAEDMNNSHNYNSAGSSNNNNNASGQSSTFVTINNSHSTSKNTHTPSMISMSAPNDDNRTGHLLHPFTFDGTTPNSSNNNSYFINRNNRNRNSNNLTSVNSNSSNDHNAIHRFIPSTF